MGDTAMAVAADSHRDSLTDGHKKIPDNECARTQMICVYSFVEDIISQRFLFFKRD
jgi:hypothetical protein